jgi:hypothetical protein
MVDGMRMDLVKSRYDNYEELYEYCYRVAGTVALMSMPVMGVDPAYKVGVDLQGALLGKRWRLPPGLALELESTPPQSGVSARVNVKSHCQRRHD